MAKRRQVVERKMTVADAVSEFFGEVTGLAEEMREAFDNTPESLQGSGAGEARGQAADNLENISEVDVPELFSQMEFTYHEFPMKKNPSRATRRDQATGMLDQLITFLNDEAKFKEDDEQERDDFVSELENAKDEFDAIEFPGMMG